MIEAMELDSITLIDRELNELISRIVEAGFEGTIDEEGFAKLAELSDTRVRLTEPEVLPLVA